MRKNFWLLLLGLGIISDTFLVRAPDWLAVVLLIISVLAFIAFYISNRKNHSVRLFVCA